MGKKKIKEEIEISWKEQFDLIDIDVKSKVMSAIKSSYCDSRLIILIGMWKKGEVIWKAMQNDKELTYYKIEKQSGRFHQNLQQWYEIYQQGPDLPEYIEKVAKKKAQEWTDKVLKANENKKLIDKCYEGFEEYKEEVKEKIPTKPKTTDTIEEVLSEQEESKEQLNHQCVECKCNGKENEQQQIVISDNGYRRTYNQIEWVQWAWNPVIGCTNDCFYCSSRSKFPDFNKPKFFPEQLEIPKRMSLPKDGIGNRVFVCQDGDLFCPEVPDEWIHQVLKVTNENPQWKFIFLSKYPERMSKFEFPKGSWVGVTVDQQELVSSAQENFDKIEADIRFLCCEPLLESLDFKGNMTMFDWMIIGGLVAVGNVNEMQPEWGWVEDVFAQAREANLLVYFKPSLKVTPKEFPK